MSTSLCMCKQCVGRVQQRPPSGEEEDARRRGARQGEASAAHARTHARTMAFILGGFSHLFAFKGAFQAEVRASSRETRRPPASFEFRRRRRENRDAGDD